MTHDSAELKDLSDLIDHPGWARLLERVQADYGPAGQRYIATLESAINTTDREQAMQDLQVVVKTRKELEGFFRGIMQRVADLRASQNPVVSLSRRGRL